jgi:acyl carrier protein
MSDEVLARVAEVIRETFGDESLVVTRETIADDVSGWDSLSHTIVVLAIGDAFGIVLPPNTQAFANVGELVDTIQRLIAS